MILSEGEDPSAQRTDLGWGIIGVLKVDSDVSVGGNLLSGVSRIALRTSAKE